MNLVKSARPLGISLLLCSMLGACALLNSESAEQSETLQLENQAAARQTVPESAEGTSNANPDRNFEAHTMYSLLVAEMAGYQNRLDIALANYAAQARDTRDAGIAERATRIAQYVKDSETALESALIWAEESPQSLEAQEVATRLLVEAGELERALTFMERALELDGSSNFDFLAINAQQMSAGQQANILNAFGTMLQRHPDNPQLLFGHAVLLRQVGRTEDALRTASRLPELAPDYVQGYLLEARLTHESGDVTGALERLHNATLRFPDDVRVRHQYARILVEADQLADAREQFALLFSKDPDNQDLRFSLALLNVEMSDFEAAETHLNALIEAGAHVDESWYYLGTIAEKRGDMEAAVRAYENIPADNNLAPRARIAQIIAEQDGVGAMREYIQRLRKQAPQHRLRLQLLEIELLMEHRHTEAALEVANLALQNEPENVELLYARAMVYADLDQIAKLEADLRKVLAGNPDNAAALNALGYTLADRTDRFEEALQLISRAIELEPEDPAIRDSLGWVQYRLGNHEEALRLLREAFEAFPDHEVAAHLGEVLWVTGNKSEARRIWFEALERKPDSELLRGVMQRFDVRIN